MNNARRTALLRASALSVAVAALAAACSSTNSSSSNSSSSTSQSVSTSSPAVASSGSDLIIGTIGNFSGPGGEASHLAGLQAWVDSVNASGGIKGRQIKLIAEDDQGDATKSQADIRQLVQIEKILRCSRGFFAAEKRLKASCSSLAERLELVALSTFRLLILSLPLCLIILVRIEVFRFPLALGFLL